MFKASDQDRVLIAAAVKKAESATTGQIVPMIVSQSDDYAAARWRIGIFTGLLCGFLVNHFFPDLDALWLLSTQIPAIGAGFILAQFAPLKRLFISKHELEDQTHHRAVEAFFAHGLHTTHDRTGVLIIISVLERKVRVLADSGINSKVPEKAWDDVIALLIAAIREKKPMDGMARAIALCGEHLASSFPGKSEVNELPDGLVTE